MWYFSWILGLGLAVSVAILNAMWLELMDEGDRAAEAAASQQSPSDEQQ